MTQQERITGKIYNLSFKKNKILRGWNLIVTEDGEEYLLKRNWSLSPRMSQQCFRLDVSLANDIYTEIMYENAKKNLDLLVWALV